MTWASGVARGGHWPAAPPKFTILAKICLQDDIPWILSFQWISTLLDGFHHFELFNRHFYCHYRSCNEYFNQKIHQKLVALNELYSKMMKNYV